MQENAKAGAAVPIVEIYTKRFCPYCWRALDLLATKPVEVREIAIDGNGPLRELMIERASGRSTVPQIFIRGEHVGGCNDLMALEREGRLDTMLEG